MAALLLLVFLYHFLISSSVIQAANDHHQAAKTFLHLLQANQRLFTTPGLWFQRSYTISGSPRGRNITRFSYAAVKLSKHGTTILHVPRKEVYFDLTIHMDVQANPGPSTLPNSGRQTTNFIHIPSTDNCPKLYYSRDQLMSFRSSCFSTKRLNPQLIRQLKYLNILKYRGKSGGTRVNKEATKIPIINKERFVSRHNLNRRANLHNLRSLHRCSNVNICDHDERSFIPVTERSGSGLKVLHLNIRSLRNISHRSQLRELNSREQFDIITISESWLNTTITSTEIQLDGYKLFRLDRLHKGGGGVCACVRSDLKSKVLKDFSSISDRNFHQLWLSIQVKKSKSIVLCSIH